MATIFSVAPVDLVLRAADTLQAIAGDPLSSQRSIPSATSVTINNFVTTVIPDATWQAVKANTANLPWLGYLLGG